MPADLNGDLTVARPLARWRNGAAAGLGVFVALGQAPFDLPLLALPALATALVLCLRDTTIRQATTAGWAFGLGYFALTLHWIVEPFLVDVARHGWMAPFAVALLAGGMALFWGAAFWAAVRLAGEGALLRRGLALVVTLTVSEMLRSVILTGFPWGLLGTIWVDTPLRMLAAWIGPHGLGALTILIAVLLAQGAVTPAIRSRIVSAGGGVVLLAMAYLVGSALERTVPTMAPAGAPVVRLIQPNASQQQKWQADMIPVFWERQLDLTRRPANPQPDVVIWPEVSVPYLLGTQPGSDAEIAAAASGAPVIVGAQRRDGSGLLNSLAVLSAGGAIGPVYDKHHLVPFGEYMPGGALARRLGLTGLATESVVGFSAGPGPQLLDLTSFGLGRALPLICYEVIFPRHARVQGQRPDWIVQITNDAWFGNFAGPQQHLAQARMRAVEQGLPLVRAANTGISAVIDPAGRIVAALALNTSGALDAALPAAQPETPFARYANLPLLGGLAAAFLALMVTPGRRRRAPETR